MPQKQGGISLLHMPLLEGGSRAWIVYAADAGRHIIAFIGYYYLPWYVGIRTTEGYTTTRKGIT